MVSTAKERNIICIDRHYITFCRYEYIFTYVCMYVCMYVLCIETKRYTDKMKKERERELRGSIA